MFVVDADHSCRALQGDIFAADDIFHLFNAATIDKVGDGRSDDLFKDARQMPLADVELVGDLRQGQRKNSQRDQRFGLFHIVKRTGRDVVFADLLSFTKIVRQFGDQRKQIGFGFECADGRVFRPGKDRL